MLKCCAAVLCFMIFGTFEVRVYISIYTHTVYAIYLKYPLATVTDLKTALSYNHTFLANSNFSFCGNQFLFTSVSLNVENIL